MGGYLCLQGGIFGGGYFRERGGISGGGYFFASGKYPRLSGFLKCLLSRLDGRVRLVLRRANLLVLVKILLKLNGYTQRPLKISGEPSYKIRRKIGES